MLVTLIGKNIMRKIVLPKEAIGNYWLSDKSGENEIKLVNIEGKDGSWQISSDEIVKIINPKSIYIDKDGVKVRRNDEQIIKQIILKEYGTYAITLGNSDSVFILYCSPVYEESFMHLDIKNTKQVFIGNNINGRIKNNIEYNNAFVENVHAKIFIENGVWNIENYDNRYGTFVNGESVSGTQVLFNGDVIFIMGLKIIIVGNSIYVNNPLKKVLFDLNCLALSEKKNISVSSKTSTNNFELYSERDYFSRAPRMTNKIEGERIRIDPPPARQGKQEVPFILVMGSSLSMGAMSMVTMTMTIDRMLSGTATVKDTVFSLIMSIVMLTSMVLFPILNNKYEKKQKAKYEETRQKKYREYIDSKLRAIDRIMDKQRKILFENNISADECIPIIQNKKPRLWERKIENYDFLTTRLGIGEVPLFIDIQYPEKSFSLEDDDLVEILNDVPRKSKILKGAPITISLVEKNISALVSQNNEDLDKIIQNLIVQLITLQSYQDLKLVFLLKKDNQHKWDYVKMLPHVWSDAKDIRFFADDYTEMEEISKYLEEELRSRARYAEENYSGADYKSFMPYYLIITDDYKRIENLKIITEVLKSKNNFGFSLLCLTNNLVQLPNECKTFINIGDKTGTIFESENSSQNQEQFMIDNYQQFDFDSISRKLSNIPIRYNKTIKTNLLGNYTFLEMYDVGRIEQLNILDRWKKNNSTLSLQAPIGRDSSGRKVSLDIHEKFHGPHGLIAGSTGSGKSEFIITYILSLAINYSPEDVTFVLIDYKGGGLAGAFQKREIKLPHLVGTITNIDTIGLQRSLTSIQSELRRRQIMFNEARNKIDEGTIDIYKYQKLYHEGIVDKPIPHLLIICDEFAELKQQQEEFMDELISVARIGRSLGVHLILATQKPAGIVNDQIRSNSKFAVCLKVQDREDSMDVIKKPDAASLKGTGQFYLQVGNDEYFTLGQAAWSGAPYFPSNVIKKSENNSVDFISNNGTIIREIDDSVQKVVNSQGEQLTNIVKYIYEAAKQQGIKMENLWLENIPETIYTSQLKKKYRFVPQKNNIKPVIGEFDDPFNQRQGLFNLSTDCNTIIYGNASSGKETLLSTMIFEMMTSYITEEVQIYVFDFGSEALKIFKPSPHVGDVVFANEDEKVNRFFNMLQKEINNRKAILSNYNGDYNLYVRTSGNSMPKIMLIINNYESFAENYGNKYEDTFLTLTREGVKCGIIFTITTSAYTDVRYRLAQNFKQKIALQINNEDDYFNIFDNVGKKRPSHMFGRGLVNIDGEIYEFQTAKICEAERFNEYIKETIDNLNEMNQEDAKVIPVVPDRVTFKDVKPALKDVSRVPVGIGKKDLKIYTFDFKKNFVSIITSKNVEDIAQYVANIMDEVELLNNVEVILFDAEKILYSKKHDLKSEFADFIAKIEERSKNNEHTFCVILGIDKFLNDLDDGGMAFSEALRIAEQFGNYSFIIAENATRLKNHEYDDWYKKYIMGDTGIWIGKGITDQYLIRLNAPGRELINDCGRSFGYIIKDENPTLIKLLEMKENGDENE